MRTIASVLSGNWVEDLRDPARRDKLIERLGPLVSNDLEYVSGATSGQLGFAEVYHGIDGFLEGNIAFVEEFEHFAAEPEEFIDLGDGRVLVHGENVIRTQGGDELRFPGSALATIENGMLRRYHSFGSRADAERAAGLH